MEGLVILFFGFIWWLLWYLTVRLCFFLGKRFRFLAPEKSYKWVMRIIVLFLFFTPTYSSLVTSVYRLVTFPILCKEMTGYQKLNPVKTDSFLTILGDTTYLTFDGVLFVEWEVIKRKKEYFEPELPMGLYRVEYFLGGNDACELYKKAYPDEKYRGVKIKGLCIGVTKITKPEARYRYQERTYWEKSRFGYRIRKYEHQAIDRFTNEKLSVYVQLGTFWEGAFAFMLEGQGNSIRCSEREPPYWEVFQKFFIINEQKGD